jgi:hypothetical protein
MQCARLILVVVLLGAATVTFAGITPQVAVTPNIAAAQLIPLTTSQKEFKIVDGKDQGRLVPLTFQPDPSVEKGWKLSFGDYGGLSLRSNSGALVMDRLDLLKSKSYVVYEPALRVLPAEIESTGALMRETGYKMYSVETGKLKRAGRVTHVVKRVSRLQFVTPAGLIDGYYIEIEHRMDMEYQSQLLLTVGLGCGLDQGLVYGSARYRLSKLGGLLTETKTSAAALSGRSISTSH